MRRWPRSAASIWASFVPFENDTLCQLISVQEIQHAVLAFNGRGPQHLMQRTLARWADDLHRLADALADNFENLFPTADLADLSDQLWLRIQDLQCIPTTHRYHPIIPGMTGAGIAMWRCRTISSMTTVDDQFDVCDLDPIIRELLAGLEPREQIVIALRYGFDGAPYTRPKWAADWASPASAVRQHRAARSAASATSPPQSPLARLSQVMFPPPLRVSQAGLPVGLSSLS